MTNEVTDERLSEIRERWGNRWEYETAGGWRPVNLRHALNDTADLLTEVERLRKQVEALQAELEICRGERFGTDPAAWAKSLPATEEGPTP